MRLKRKGQALNIGILSSLVAVAIIFILTTIILSFGADVTSDLGDDIYEDASNTATVAYNITDSGLSGMDEIGQKLPTIGLIIAIGIIIALLLGFLGFAAVKNFNM